MVELSLWNKLKSFIGGIAFDIFLWSISMTGEEYRRQIMMEERAHLMIKWNIDFGTGLGK